MVAEELALLIPLGVRQVQATTISVPATPPPAVQVLFPLGVAAVNLARHLIPMSEVGLGVLAAIGVQQALRVRMDMPHPLLDSPLLPVAQAAARGLQLWVMQT